MVVEGSACWCYRGASSRPGHEPAEPRRLQVRCRESKARVAAGSQALPGKGGEASGFGPLKSPQKSPRRRSVRLRLPAEPRFLKALGAPVGCPESLLTEVTLSARVSVSVQSGFGRRGELGHLVGAGAQHVLQRLIQILPRIRAPRLLCVMLMDFATCCVNDDRSPTSGHCTAREPIFPFYERRAACRAFLGSGLQGRLPMDGFRLLRRVVHALREEPLRKKQVNW